ncbi:MFS transporter [Microlunatus speluncae]|uniref:MFS transporter n=1 Tax=Microlunatus speluncae TaxID=2594267 RepID=UPI001375F3CB|nr:MFS transporter [Microlunatus speluncae]
MRRSSLPENSRSKTRPTLTRLLGLPSIRGHVPLVVALCVDAIGTGLAGPLVLLYLITVAGLPVATAGIVVTASGVLSLAVPALSAAISGRVGPRTIVIFALLLQAVGTAGLLLAAVPAGRALPILIACCLLNAVGGRAFWSSVFSLIADAADGAEAAAAYDQPENERRSGKDAWFALSGMTQGVGFAVGALLAGALLIMSGSLPYLIALAVNAASFVAAAVLLARDPGHPKIVPPPADDQPRRGVHRDRPYLLLIAANTLFAFCSTVLGVGLPLYVVEGLDAPAWLIGPLLALNTILGATCQGIAVRATRRFRRIRVLVVAGLIWAVWGAVTATLGLAPLWLIVPGLIISVLIYSVAELTHAPVSMGLASDAAPAAARASYLSVFQYSFALATIAAPGTFAITFAATPALPWLVTSVIAVLGCIAILLAGRGLATRLRE